MIGQDALVSALDEARRTGKAMRLPTALQPGLTVEEAYAVQHAWIRRREGEGRRRIGYKVALTTPGAQRGLGVDRPGYGVLLDDMLFGEGTPIPAGRFLAPRVEIELAFVMRTELSGPCTPAEALAAVDWAAPAGEIIDNRVVLRDPETGGMRSGIDIIADGGGAAGLVVSDKRFDPRTLDLSRIGAVLSHNGDIEDSGVFAVVFGSPENALSWLAEELATRGERIAAGDIILCGSVIKPFPAAPGDKFLFDYGPLGTLSLEFDRA